MWWAVARELWQLYGACVPNGIGAVVFPSIRSLFSKSAGPERQGAMLSAVSSLEALSSVVAPALFGPLFAQTVADFPQCSWLVMAGLCAISGLLLSYQLCTRAPAAPAKPLV